MASTGDVFAEAHLPRLRRCRGKRASQHSALRSQATAQTKGKSHSQYENAKDMKTCHQSAGERAYSGCTDLCRGNVVQARSGAGR